MNPLLWKREHKLALGLAVMIGCIAGIVTGYLVHAAPGGGRTFYYWLFGFFGQGPIENGVFLWAIAGGLIGGVIVYIKRLSATPD